LADGDTNNASSNNHTVSRIRGLHYPAPGCSIPCSSSRTPVTRVHTSVAAGHTRSAP